MGTITLSLLFTTMSAAYDLPPHLLESLCYVESTHDIHAVHEDDGGSDSLGVCQIKYATAEWLGFKGTEKQLMEPKNNIKYAALYLKYNINRYGGDVTKGVIAYNRGNAKGLTVTAYSDKVFKQYSLLAGR